MTQAQSLSDSRPSGGNIFDIFKDRWGGQCWSRVSKGGNELWEKRPERHPSGLRGSPKELGFYAQWNGNHWKHNCKLRTPGRQRPEELDAKFTAWRGGFRTPAQSGTTTPVPTGASVSVYPMKPVRFLRCLQRLALENLTSTQDFKQRSSTIYVMS